MTKMKITTTGSIRTKLAISFVLLLAAFSFVAAAQTANQKPLDADAAAYLVFELGSDLPNYIDDEATVSAIIDKWDLREDLAGKTRAQILKLLMADVRSVVKNKKIEDEIWKSWNEVKTESPVDTPQRSVTPSAETPLGNETPPAVVPEQQPGQTSTNNGELKGYAFLLLLLPIGLFILISLIGFALFYWIERKVLKDGGGVDERAIKKYSAVTNGINCLVAMLAAGPIYAGFAWGILTLYGPKERHEFVLFAVAPSICFVLLFALIRKLTNKLLSPSSGLGWKGIFAYAVLTTILTYLIYFGAVIAAMFSLMMLGSLERSLQ